MSLVSVYEEKVWYYDKRKWEGKTLSTKLADQVRARARARARVRAGLGLGQGLGLRLTCCSCR